MKKYLALLVLGVLAFASTPAQAEFLEWKLDYEFSGSGATLGEGGYVGVKLESVVSGTVVLTLDTYEIPDNSKFIGLYLNVNPAFEPGYAMTFNAAGVSPAPVEMVYSPNAYKADGDGNFDVYIGWWPSGGAGDEAAYLPANTIATITMTGENLVASSFDFLSYPEETGYPNAARIRSLNDPNYPTQPNTEGSGWFTSDGSVPEASTLMLFGSGLSGLLFFVRKKRLIKL